MRRMKPRLIPHLDAMEPRLLLSTTPPREFKYTASAAAHEIKAIVNGLAKSGDRTEADANLTTLASQLMPGSALLATAWIDDVAFVRPNSVKSTIIAQRRLIADLHQYLAEGGPSGSGTNSTNSGSPTQGSPGTTVGEPTPTPGPGTTGTNATVPTPSLDSVQIENLTGLSLVVTVKLGDSLNPQPYITETIAAQTDPTVLFNFGTSTGAFMTMNVSRADGLPSPAPFDNIQLSQPLGGYNATLFTISLLAPISTWASLKSRGSLIAKCRLRQCRLATNFESSHTCSYESSLRPASRATYSHKRRG